MVLQKEGRKKKKERITELLISFQVVFRIIMYRSIFKKYLC